MQEVVIQDQDLETVRTQGQQLAPYPAEGELVELIPRNVKVGDILAHETVTEGINQSVLGAHDLQGKHAHQVHASRPLVAMLNLLDGIAPQSHDAGYYLLMFRKERRHRLISECKHAPA